MKKDFKKQLKKFNNKEWNSSRNFKDFNFTKDTNDVDFALALVELAKENTKNKKYFNELNSLTDVSEQFIRGFSTTSSYPDTSLAKAVEFIDCEASSELSSMVWLLNSKNGGLTSTKNIGVKIEEKSEWEHISESYSLPITKKGDIYVQFEFSEVNNKIICRYYASSTIVNFDLIEKWMDKNIFVNGLTRRDNNHKASAYLSFNKKGK